MSSRPLSPARLGSPEVLRLGERAFIQVEAPSFDRLPLTDKLLAYHLSEAAIHLDPIFDDQLADYGLALRRLLAGLAAHADLLPGGLRRPIVDYALQCLGCGGNRNEATGRKFLPDFTFDDLSAAVAAVIAAGAPLGPIAVVERTLHELRRPIFDPAYAAVLTEKNPPAGIDILTASANNFYRDVTLADLEGFEERHPLNARLARGPEGLVEEVYRAGTADGAIPPGRYAEFLRAANAEIREAARYAAPAGAAALTALARYFESGAPTDWDTYNRLWLASDGDVEFTAGFVEVYRDARGAKGSVQAMVTVRDRELDPLMRGIAADAPYFEHRMPWADRYKKLDVRPPVGKAAETVIGTGDAHVSMIGVNLPNEEWIRAESGSKSLLFTSSLGAIGQVRGSRVAVEFAPEPEHAELFDRYGKIALELHVALHEILGHGSGLCEPGVEPSSALREFYSTLEETRADLVAYWHCADPRLAELGVRDVPEVARECYRQLARLGLTTLAKYPHGDIVEEDHDRNRLLIVNYLIEQGAFVRFERGGRFFIDVADFPAARAAVGRLLGEIMRIKATGDYEAIRDLVLRYAIRFEPAHRDDVLARWRRLEAPTYFSGVYPELSPIRNERGAIVDVAMAIPRDPLRQRLGWARKNGTLGF